VLRGTRLNDASGTEILIIDQISLEAPSFETASIGIQSLLAEVNEVPRGEGKKGELERNEKHKCVRTRVWIENRGWYRE